jgi:hypothetical protein
MPVLFKILSEVREYKYEVEYNFNEPDTCC